MMTLKEQLQQLEEALLQANVRTTKENLHQYLADDFFEFGSSGQVLYKDENINELDLGVVKMTLSKFEIHPLSEDVVLATYMIYNELTTQYSLRSSIWKKIDNKWKMKFHQGTKINNET